MIASEQHTESRRASSRISAQTRYQCGEGQCCSFSIKLEFTSTGRHQTRAVHHSVTTSDWLAQAQAAVEQPDSSVSDLGPKKSFNVIGEFNGWRKQPDLAKAID
ncbi:hypothetical protein F2Q69_00031472 [Brassica cretica]|uniref:Uncharacterized protein n=1 Tax=Brassica cretica TaxID=69181 RepID=A0A8S9RW04_BRACR|nr:hypothetical protein F2Q69_00031472 [Brassica cretica]